MGKKSIEERIQEEAHFLVERIRNTNGRIWVSCLLGHAMYSQQDSESYRAGSPNLQPKKWEYASYFCSLTQQAKLSLLRVGQLKALWLQGVISTGAWCWKSSFNQFCLRNKTVSGKGNVLMPKLRLWWNSTIETGLSTAMYFCASSPAAWNKWALEKWVTREIIYRYLGLSPVHLNTK